MKVSLDVASEVRNSLRRRGGNFVIARSPRNGGVGGIHYINSPDGLCIN